MIHSRMIKSHFKMVMQKMSHKRTSWIKFRVVRVSFLSDIDSIGFRLLATIWWSVVIIRKIITLIGG